MRKTLIAPEHESQPAQMYLTTLESTKAWSLGTAAMARWAPNEAARAGLANSFAGAVASMVTQTVVVPIDVVSQRLMIAGVAQQLHSALARSWAKCIKLIADHIYDTHQ